MNIKEHTLVKSIRCLNCGEEHDFATAMDGGDYPKPGDLDICVNCAALAKFTDQGGLEPISDEEIRSLPAEKQFELQKIRQAVLAVKIERRANG